MNISHLAAPRVLAPLHGLWRWIAHAPLSQTTATVTDLASHPAFTASQPLNAKSALSQTPAALTTLAARKPLRIIRVLDHDHTPAHVGRMVISGRMADVCAELDRLADRETALH